MYIYHGTSMKAVSAPVPDLKELTILNYLKENDIRLKAENEILDMVHAELLKTLHDTESCRSVSSVNKMINEIPSTHLRVSMTLEKIISAYVEI